LFGDDFVSLFHIKAGNYAKSSAQVKKPHFYRGQFAEELVLGMVFNIHNVFTL
jgi:hypothetical protein